MQNDCIYLKLNTRVRDKICFYMHICTQRIRYESAINRSLPIVSDGNARDNVALWGQTQVKDNTKYVEVSAGQENWSGGKKQRSRASFYSSFISAENCLCSGIRRKCARRRARSRNPFIYDIQHAECILDPQFNSSAVHTAQCCVSQLCLV